MQRQLIKDLKPEIRNQLVAIRETLHKVLYEDKTLGEKLRTLFREQGVTIASILTAIGMTVSAVVEGIVLATINQNQSLQVQSMVFPIHQLNHRQSQNHLKRRQIGLKIS